MKYAYPAVLHPAKEGGYWVEFPDLDGCFSQGETIDESIFMAEDAASIWLCGQEDNRLPAVSPSSYNYKSSDPNDIVTVIRIDTDEYRKKSDNRAVKKTLSIPNWLNEKALAAHINFSAVLQDGLKRQLGITQ
ncbi:MAG: type II toxin-antitoxin system HicB family antitoxin [Ruminococcus sp.]|jgi:predicted RNase H-like HicB family nuclease|nr:type II toxin-antitoxin system HicB family antitoxin [Ruminococcus sp.]